jgi:hypothetical protein
LPFATEYWFGANFPLDQNGLGQKVFKKEQNLESHLREIENEFGPARAQRPGVERWCNSTIPLTGSARD